MKKHKRDSIMVAVRDLGDSSRRLLRKAAGLARSRGCDVELVHIVALPFAPSVNLRAPVRQAAKEIVDDCMRRLARLAKSPELRGITARTIVAWDYPAADGLVRQVLRRRPQMLLAESQRHARLARPFMSNTDWELIRKCPCPLWLSKSHVAERAGPIIAALDPLHAHAKPASLDSLILRQAVDAAGERPARLIAFHAYAPPAPAIVDGAVEAYWIGMSEEEVERYKLALRRQLDRLADTHGVLARNRLLVTGDPVVALPRAARKYRAAVVVMGAVSRSALARLFIGHTAERVIDALDSDVLIVKPRGFKTSVDRRPHHAVRLPPT